MSPPWVLLARLGEADDTMATVVMVLSASPSLARSMVMNLVTVFVPRKATPVAFLTRSQVHTHQMVA